MTEKVYEDSESGYSVYKIDATSAEDIRIIQSAIVEGTEFLESKGIKLNPIDQQIGRHVREGQMSEYGFITVKNDDIESRQMTFELIHDPDVLRPLNYPVVRPLNHPTSDGVLKTVFRYCNEELFITPELVLAHTSGYHPYEYVDRAIKFTRGENKRFTDNFSAYEIDKDAIL
jgi:hypothetical protein